MAAGRPTKYLAVYAGIAAQFARDGHTQARIAQLLGIDRPTLWRWQSAYPEFCNALKPALAVADDRVELSLYEKAVGTTRTVEKAILVKDGKDRERVEVVTLTEELPGDVAAQIFWLKNRRRDEWKDRLDFEGSTNVTWVFDDPTQRPEGYSRKRVTHEAGALKAS